MLFKPLRTVLVRPNVMGDETEYMKPAFRISRPDQKMYHGTEWEKQHNIACLHIPANLQISQIPRFTTSNALQQRARAGTVAESTLETVLNC